MRTNLLIVDDSASSRKGIIVSLRNDSFRGSILEAENGSQALDLICNRRVDLIITDVVMPKMDGFKLLRALRDDERYAGIPIILLTVRSQIPDRVKGLELGAWDFLVKPIHPVELMARIKAMLRIKLLQDKMRIRLRQLERLSVVDSLTGLYNKRYLVRFLKREINRCKRFGFTLSCLMIDVDRFKSINDVYGHPKADRILKELSSIIAESIRGYDFAARFGGDEFTLVLPQLVNANNALNLAERLRKNIERHSFGKVASRKSIHITVSIGIGTFTPERPLSHEALMDRADKALYKSKKMGRNRISTL